MLRRLVLGAKNANSALYGALSELGSLLLMGFVLSMGLPFTELTQMPIILITSIRVA